MPWTDDSGPGGEPRPWDLTPQADPDRRDGDGGKTPAGPWGDVEGSPTAARRPRLTLRPPGPVRPTSGRPASAPRPRRPERTGRDPRAGAWRIFGLPTVAAGLRLRAADLAAAVGASARRPRDLRTVAAGVLALVAAGWTASGVFIVAPGETAVVERFGAAVGETGPGLGYHAPWPVGSAHLVRTGAPSLLHIGEGAAATSADGLPVSLAYDVVWRVADPSRFLFAVVDAPDALRALAGGAMQEAVGRESFAALTSPDHAGLAADARDRLQAALDRWGAGVKVLAVQVREVDLAGAVAGAQDGSGNASAYRARVVEQARIDAARAVGQARATSAQEVAEAKGEAARFALIEPEYRKAPQATRDRLYTETMERVLRAAPKVVVQLPKGATLTLPPGALRPPVATAPASSTPPPRDAT